MLSLSGRPPNWSFQAHCVTSLMSFDPPVVKMVALPEPSAMKVEAKASLDPPGGGGTVLAQSSLGALSTTALPSSSNCSVGTATSATLATSTTTTAPNPPTPHRSIHLRMSPTS